VVRGDVGVVRGALAAALTIVGLTPAAAQRPDWQVDIGATTLSEAWNYNESRETLAGVVVGIDGQIWKALGIRVEGSGLHVGQQPRDAWLGGMSVGPRARWTAGRVQPFLDLAAGLARATRAVPQRGTLLNYLLVAGGGVRLPLGRTSVDIGARWLHISNNGREGRDHNPDIQSLGLSMAIAILE
jgi:hypothetical protein